MDKEKTCYWTNNWHILKVSDGKEKFVSFQACFRLHFLSLIPHEFMYFQTTSQKCFCIIPKVLLFICSLFNLKTLTVLAAVLQMSKD